MSIQIKFSDFVMHPIDELFKTIVEPTQLAKYFMLDTSDFLFKGNLVIWDSKFIM